MIKPNETEIRLLADNQTFGRGYQYFKDGSVSNVIKRGQKVSARVDGSQYRPYEITIRLNESGNVVQYFCTCPYDWGGACKHVVAVLLELIHNSEHIEEKPPLHQLLPQLSADHLCDILLALIDDNFELTEKVEQYIENVQSLPAKSTDPNKSVQASETKQLIDIPRILRDIQNGFETSDNVNDDRFDGYGYYYDEYEGLEIYPQDGLIYPLSQVDQLLDKGNFREAEKLIWMIVDAFAKEYSRLEEWVIDYNEDPIYLANLDLDTKLAEVILSEDFEENLDQRRRWESEIQKRKNSQLNFGVSQTALDHGWTYPPLVSAMEGNITSRGAWANENPPMHSDELSLARLRVLARQNRTEEYINLATAEGQGELAITMMAHVGRTAEAIDEAKTYLTSPSSLFSVVKALFKHGDQAESFALADHGLGLDNDGGMYALAKWLRDQTRENEAHRPLSLKAAQVAFEYSQNRLTDYQIVQKMAGPEWPTIKPKLLKQIARLRDLSSKIDIYLMEHMIDEAMWAIDQAHFAGDYDLHRVLDRTRMTHPDWGIKQCQGKGESIMDAGESKNYEIAARWLEMARDIYLMHGRVEEWETYLSQILETHHRKYKLVPLLRAIRSPNE